MLGNENFYNKSIRKYTTAFANVFNDLSIERDDGDIIKVPVSFGGKQKYIQRYEQNSSIDDRVEPKVKMTLPRMAFMINGLQYDASRQQQKTQRISKSQTGTNLTVKYQYVAVPYNINYQLSVVANTLSDMLAIIEQILPYFNPEYNLTVIDNPLYTSQTDNTFSDIPLILSSINPIIDYDGNFDDRRLITCDLDFVMKIHLYGPVGTGKVIKDIKINYRDLDYFSDVDNLWRTHRIQPDPLNANKDDDYGYTETVTDFENN